MDYDPKARTRVVDFARALSRMDIMLEDNEPRHRAAWADQPPTYHLEHGKIHATDAGALLDPEASGAIGPTAWDFVDQIEEELTSAALRHVMALERFLEIRRAVRAPDED